MQLGELKHLGPDTRKRYYDSVFDLLDYFRNVCDSLPEPQRAEFSQLILQLEDMVANFEEYRETLRIDDIADVVSSAVSILKVLK